MDIFRIEGPVTLRGSVRINGSKNASLPVMAAAILAAGKSTLKAVPNLSDIFVCGRLLGRLGCKVTRSRNGDLSIDSTVIDNPVGEYEIVRRMRAGICILGPLLARCQKARRHYRQRCVLRAVYPHAAAKPHRPFNTKYIHNLFSLKRQE